MARKRKESAQLGALLAKNLRAVGGSGGFAGAVHKDDAKKVRYSCNTLQLEVLKKCLTTPLSNRESPTLLFNASGYWRSCKAKACYANSRKR
jgi:hypothetical protein